MVLYKQMVGSWTEYIVMWREFMANVRQTSGYVTVI